MQRIHIFPMFSTGGPYRTTHCTDKSEMCWCKPELKQVCSESNEHGRCKANCWSCGGSGLVDPYDNDLNVLIIHKLGQREPDGLDMRRMNATKN